MMPTLRVTKSILTFGILAAKCHAAASIAEDFGAGWGWVRAISVHSEVKVATIIPGDGSHAMSLRID